MFNKIFGGQSNCITFPWPEIPSRIEIAAEIERPCQAGMACINGIPAYFTRAPGKPVRDLAVIGDDHKAHMTWFGVDHLHHQIAGPPLSTGEVDRPQISCLQS